MIVGIIIIGNSINIIKVRMTNMEIKRADIITIIKDTEIIIRIIMAIIKVATRIETITSIIIKAIITTMGKERIGPVIIKVTIIKITKRTIGTIILTDKTSHIRMIIKILVTKIISKYKVDSRITMKASNYLKMTR